MIAFVLFLGFYSAMVRYFIALTGVRSRANRFVFSAGARLLSSESNGWQPYISMH
jgi:hypothetical protein